MSVRFGGATPNVGVAVYTGNYAASADVTLITNGGLDHPELSQVAVRAGTAMFGGTGITATCGGNECYEAEPIYGSVEGFFAGKKAERAGLSYSIGNNWIYGIFPMGLAADSPLPPSVATLLDTSGALSMAHVGPDRNTPLARQTIAALMQDAYGLLLTYSPGAPDNFMINTAQGADFGGDASIAWGRWTDGAMALKNAGGTSANAAMGSQQGFHYVIGQPTPVLQSSGTANFTLLGASKPTNSDGIFPVGTLTSTGPIAMAVEWGGNAATKLALDLTATMPSDGSYRMQTSGGLASPATSELSTSGSAFFSGAVPVTATGRDHACVGASCEARIEGFFAGPGPVSERAGIAYRIGPQVALSNSVAILGSAAFTLDSFTPAAPPPGPVVLTAPAATTFAYAMNDFGMDIQGPGGATQATDAQLNGYSLTSSPASFAPQRGTATTAEGGGDSLITWGRWTGGTFTGPLSVLPESDSRRTFNANQGLHYVVGAETPISGLPLGGTATFNLLGATNPTWGDGALAPGTFTGSMAVRWGGSTTTTVGANFSVVMPGDKTYSIVTSGGLANPAASGIAIVAGTARFSGSMQAANPGGRAQCSALCDAMVSGFFAGPAAERAGIAYTVGPPGSTAISGAAAFTR